MRDQEQRRRIRLENKFISQNVFAGAEEVLTYLTVIKLNQSLISSKISPNAPTHHDEVKRHRLCISVLPKGMQVAGIPGQMDYAPKLHLLKIKGPKKYHLKGTWPLKSILKIDGLDSASEDKKFSLSCSGGKRGKKNQIFFFEAVNDHAHDSRNWFFWMMIQISGVFLQIVPLTSNLDVMALEENGRNRLSILGPSKSENKNSSSITEEICEAEETLIAAIEKNLLLKNKRRPSIYEELGEKFEIPPMTPEEARDIEWFLSDTGLGIEKIHELKGVLLSKLESLDSQNTIALFSSQLAQNPIAKGLSNLKQDVLDVVGYC